MADITKLTTGELELPDHIMDPWLEKIRFGSSVAALSTAIPMKFGKGQAVVWDTNEAEYVGEAQNKGPSKYTKSVMNSKPYKFHKTVRWSDEVVWASEDYQLDVLNQILNLIQPKLSRALDFGVIHGVNPASGTGVTEMSPKIVDTTKTLVHDPSAKPYEILDTADNLLLGSGKLITGFALDPSLAGVFRTARLTQTEQRMYPGFALTTAPSDLEGYRASVSDTVRAAEVIDTDTGVEGIIGNFDAVGWGIQRSIGLKLIEFGDPDGQGDLQRNNQVAFRAEIVYGWGIADLDAFAVVKSEDEGD